MRSKSGFIVTVWKSKGRYFADRHTSDSIYYCPPEPAKEVFSVSGKYENQQDAADVENRACDEAERRGLRVENLTQYRNCK